MVGVVLCKVVDYRMVCCGWVVYGSEDEVSVGSGEWWLPRREERASWFLPIWLEAWDGSDTTSTRHPLEEVFLYFHLQAE